MGYEYIFVEPGTTGRKVAVDQYTPTPGPDTFDIQIVKLAHGADGEVDGLVDDASPLPVALPGKTQITVTPTIQAAAYAAGELIGTTVQQFPNAVRAAGKGGRITQVVIVDQANQKAPIDLVLFKANPATTLSENNPLDLVDADLLISVGHIVFAAADYVSFVDNALGTKVINPGLDFVLDSGTTLYCLLCLRGAATFTTTSDLQITLVIDRD